MGKEKDYDENQIKKREKSFSIDTVFTYEVHISERVEGINFS